MLLSRAMTIAVLGVFASVPSMGAGGAQDAAAPFASPWRIALADAEAAHVLAAGAVVLVSGPAQIAAYAAADGRHLWRREVPSTRPPVTLGTGVVVSDDRMVTVLDPETGVERWHATVPAGTTGITGVGDLLIAQAGASLGAWNAAGTGLWQLNLGEDIVAIAKVAEALFAATSGHLVAIDSLRGSILARLALPERPASLAADHDRLFLSGSRGGLFSVRVSPTLRLGWRQRAVVVPAIGNPAVDGRRAYYALVDNTVTAFDRAGGSRQWARALGARAAAGPRVAGESVVAPLTNGRLVELAVRDGRVLSPSADDGPGAAFQDWTVSVDGGTICILTVQTDNTRTLALWRRPAAKSGQTTDPR